MMFCYTCGLDLEKNGFGFPRPTTCPNCGPCWLLDGNQPCADLLVRHNHSILLIQRKDNGLWCTPGGHVDAKEHPKDAAIREFEEETGIKFSRRVDAVFNERALADVSLVGVYLHDKGHYCNQITMYQTYVYSDYLNKKKINTDEVTDIRWFKFHELPEHEPFLDLVIKDIFRY